MLVVTLTMRPHLWRSMCGTAARAMLKGPLALVSMIARQTSGVAVQNLGGSNVKLALTSPMPMSSLKVPVMLSTMTNPTIANTLKRRKYQYSAR